MNRARLFRAALGALADQALHLELPADVLAVWRELSDPAGLAADVAHPDFYSWDAQSVAVERFP